MTIFRLKQIASTSFHAAADAMHWNYDRAELIADRVGHILGVGLGPVAAARPSGGGLSLPQLAAADREPARGRGRCPPGWCFRAGSGSALPPPAALPGVPGAGRPS